MEFARDIKLETTLRKDYDESDEKLLCRQSHGFDGCMDSSNTRSSATSTY